MGKTYHGSLNTAFSNPTMNRQGHVIATFVSLVKNVEMITLCDADLNDEVVHEYEEISERNFYCIDYSHRKLEGRVCKFRTFKLAQFSAMERDLLNNPAIVYTSQSVKACRRAFKHAKNTIPNKKLVLIMGNICEIVGYDELYPANANERKEYMLNHLGEFENCDFLATTPTITSGVSFNKKDHFYRVYGYIMNSSNSHRSYVQQINRIRYPITTEYDIYVNPNVCL